MIVKIEKMDHQGRGICHINEKITFVDNALPNEEVEINITKSKKNYNEAIIKKYITKSFKRINNICPFYDKCGGCNLLHISYNDQLKYKEEKVKNIMERFANIKCISKIMPCEKSLYYRNKITLKVKNNKIGYYEKKSNEIVEINNCLLVENKINNIIKDLKKFDLNNIYEIVIRNINSEKTALTIYLHKPTSSIQILKYCEKNNIILNKIVKNNHIKISNKGKIIGNLLNYKFIVSPYSFFQVNTEQTIKLYDLIVKYLNPTKNDEILDLYCGTGTIGIYLAKYVKSIIGIEINKDAINDANINKKINNINNIEFFCGDTEEIIKSLNKKITSIIVDPPRAGLSKNVINDIIRINPIKIIYVSCDPITLARDLKLLNNNYKVISVTPVDMFPNTYHIENIAVLEQI